MIRIAVVTPYYKETIDVLMKCHESVLGQTYPCVHLLVADGHPKRIFDMSDRTMHMILPKENSDNGNTPRALGGISADTYGFDAVAYLDADNWYEPDHIANLLKSHENTGNDIISCKRRFYDLKGNILHVTQPDEEKNLHVDTSCWLIFRPAFAMLRVWLMPKPLSPICDRIFFKKIFNDRYNVTFTDWRTVAFRTQYTDHYQAAGAPIPDAAKSRDWCSSSLAFLKSAEGIIATTKHLGFYPDSIFS